MWQFKQKYFSCLLPVIATGLFFIALSSCNKKNTNKEEEPIAEDPFHRSKFLDTLATTTSTQNIYVANSRNNNFLYVVQKQSNGSFTLLKCNDNGDLVYTKSLNLGTDQLVEIEGDENTDSFYTLNASFNFSHTGAAINAYVYNWFNNDSTIPCDSSKFSDYSFNANFITNNETSGINSGTLRKFSDNGIELWNKQLDGNYFNGNAIETDAEGNIYVLTAGRSGVLPYMAIPANGTVSPYYNFKLDSNYFSVYKFDSNGNQLFKKTVTSVFEGMPGQFKPSLVLSKYNIGVYNANNVYFFDLNGALISTAKPIKNSCYNFITACVGNIRQNNIFVQGYLNYKTGISGAIYFEAFNPGGFSLVNYNSNTVPLLKMNRKGELIAASTKTLKKYDAIGNLVYDKYYPEIAFTFNTNNTVTDKFSAFYSFGVASGKILVYKFGANGNYN